jgi:beta-xylosidase
MSNIIERRIFVDTIIKNGIISVNEIYEEMVKNDFSNGYSTDKNYIYSRLKTLGIDLIKIRIFHKAYELKIVEYKLKQDDSRKIKMATCLIFMFQISTFLVV